MDTRLRLKRRRNVSTDTLLILAIILVLAVGAFLFWQILDNDPLSEVLMSSGLSDENMTKYNK